MVRNVGEKEIEPAILHKRICIIGTGYVKFLMANIQ